MRKVLLVGAGNISDIHAEILRGLPNVELWGVTDSNPDAASKLARRWSIRQVFPSLEAAIESGNVECAHVLTPPDAHCVPALPLLRAGISVLVEKPLATTSTDCDTLCAVARASGAKLAVNQNFVFDPAFVRLRNALTRGELGPLRAIDCTFNVQLRQLAARQFGHWMFREPLNLLLEQAVHPLSQIATLLGEIEAVAASSEPAWEISAGRYLYPRLNATLRSASVTAQLNFAVGSNFPVWQLRIDGDDGAAIADMTNNRLISYKRTRWLDPIDQAVSGMRAAFNAAGDATRNLTDFLLSAAGVVSRRDSFFRSMKSSISAFHHALDQGSAIQTDGRFGRQLVTLCEQIAQAIPFVKNAPAARKRSNEDFDSLVVGGTGFIGAHVVKRLLQQGRRVGVLARNVENLPAIFDDDRVVLLRGDIRSKEDVNGAIRSARTVINLAHGGAGGDFEAVRAAMVGGAENVAQACLSRGVERLIHVGSIASLYLGRRGEIVSGDTPIDGRPELRADYARAKAECDAFLLGWARQSGLRVHVLRPGVVVGAGGMPSHTGVGFFNNDQHCIGWGRGLNPLPFVLADDVADAIAAACFAKTSLKPA